MKKEGQVTIYIIIGIVVVLAIGLAVMFRGEIIQLSQQIQLKGTTEAPLEIQKIKDDLQSCVKKTFEDGVWLMGLQSGYLMKSDNVSFLYIANVSIAYSSDEGLNRIPSIKTMQLHLAKYLKANIPECFNVYSYTKVDIYPSTIVPQVKISDKAISANVKYDLQVTHKNVTYTLTKPYKTTISIRLGMIRDIASKIVDNEIKDWSVDVEYLKGLEFDIGLYAVDSLTNVYIITDDKSKIQNNNYSFMFASRWRP